MHLRFAGLAAGILLGLALTACGSDSNGEGSVEKVPLLAEVCVEGRGQAAGLIVRNLNDFEWGEVKFSLTKGTRITSKYTLERDSPSVWPPESITQAEPFKLPKNWIYRGRVAGRPQEVLRRLTFFSSLTGAIIEIEKPFEATWESNEPVTACA